MMLKQRKTIAAIVRLMSVIALVMVGFAHKPVVAQPLKLQFAAYILPDGTLPTLCLNDDPSQPATLADHGCDACRLAAAILVPAPPRIAAHAIAFSTVVAVFARQHALVRSLYPPSSGPRAPPVDPMLS
jgi:hypothetical protein